jgi:hypothetical protein
METWTPDQQRTPPQKGGALRSIPGNAAYTDLILRRRRQTNEFEI